MERRYCWRHLSLCRRKDEFTEHRSHCYEIFNRRSKTLLLKELTLKDSTLQKSPCDHNSKIPRLTKKITYLRNENRTKSCIIQMLLLKLLHTNNNDFKAPYKYVRNSKNYSANNTYIAASNRHQELKDDDIKNDSNTRNYVKPTTPIQSSKTNEADRVKENQLR